MAVNKKQAKEYVKTCIRIKSPSWRQIFRELSQKCCITGGTRQPASSPDGRPGLTKLAPQGPPDRVSAVMRLRWTLWLAGGVLAAGAEPPSPTPPPSTDELYKLGQQLFDEYAPPEVKEQYEFPTKEQWDAFAARLQHALDSNSLEDLADYEPEARTALAALRTLPGHGDYADWLELRIDDIEAAKQAVARRSLPAPGPPLAGRTEPAIPLYDLWLARERARPVPGAAAALMPRLREAFTAEGVPPELAWLAEAESTLNPDARSPAGAAGLFQLMPDTAHALGLGTFLPDERKDPEKSARAAARYLRALYGKFGSWPLALAAYNAGEGRVRRELASRGATDFAGVAAALPAQTRMYVPKVCALVDVRTGMAPDRLPPPRA
jgi:membrane-bound lytic murein transglycosylase D